jgi:hypothetical protein
LVEVEGISDRRSFAGKARRTVQNHPFRLHHHTVPAVATKVSEMAHQYPNLVWISGMLLKFIPYHDPTTMMGVVMTVMMVSALTTSLVWFDDMLR